MMIMCSKFQIYSVIGYDVIQFYNFRGNQLSFHGCFSIGVMVKECFYMPGEKIIILKTNCPI